MNTPEMLSMQSEDDAIDLGVVFSPSPETLRVFGASYMQDKETSGTLKILDPQGATYASYDVWQNTWILPA
ncbi:hypothetical protein [Tateyamaria sp.]|uniref:hypothetical protein n=1 Tax=Tateyamaria sp. TaxID=1929288 RepID=UPI003B20C60C